MPLAYDVLLESRAERDLRRLPVTIFATITEQLIALSENPRPRGSRKLVGSQRDWRLRVGDYRFIYEIDDEAQEVRVMRIRHRREVYR